MIKYIHRLVTLMLLAFCLISTHAYYQVRTDAKATVEQCHVRSDCIVIDTSSYK